MSVFGCVFSSLATFLSFPHSLFLITTRSILQLSPIPMAHSIPPSILLALALKPGPYWPYLHSLLRRKALEYRFLLGNERRQCTHTQQQQVCSIHRQFAQVCFGSFSISPSIFGLWSSNLAHIDRICTRYWDEKRWSIGSYSVTNVGSAHIHNKFAPSIGNLRRCALVVLAYLHQYLDSGLETWPILTVFTLAIETKSAGV